MKNRRKQLERIRSRLADRSGGGKGSKAGNWNFFYSGGKLGIGFSKNGSNFQIQIALPQGNGYVNPYCSQGGSGGGPNDSQPISSPGNGNADNQGGIGGNSVSQGGAGGNAVEQDGAGGNADDQGGAGGNDAGQGEAGGDAGSQGGVAGESNGQGGESNNGLGGGDAGSNGDQGGNDDAPPSANGSGEGDNSSSQGSPGPGQAESVFESALASFKKNDYATALKLADEAAKQLPNNADVHQFRALTLFAMKEYKRAAAAAHKALTGEAGWDWDTLRSLYSSKDRYTAELRALEAFTEKNPTASEARFLLAYHYLMLNYVESAKTELKKVVELEPRDALSAALLKAISKS